MKYATADIKEADEAMSYLTRLIGQEAVVEVKKINPKRTLRQNSYLHLLLGAFGMHFGYTIEEAKYLFKEVNRDIFFYTKKGRQFIKSSADLDTKELTKAIDKFMHVSAEAGCPLPLAENEAELRPLANSIEQNMYI